MKTAKETEIEFDNCRKKIEFMGFSSTVALPDLIALSRKVISRPDPRIIEDI